MYNEKRKMDYLLKNKNRSKTVRSTSQSIFNKIEKKEIELDRDVCSFTIKELNEACEGMFGTRKRSQYASYRVLKEYLSWCFEQGFADASESFKNFQCEPDGIMLLNNTVANPQQLEQYLNEICLPASEQATDNIYRCYYWLAYAGMKEADIIKVEKKHVDFKNMVVSFEGEEYPIYKEGVLCIRNCAELTSFLFSHPNHTSISFIDRAPGDTLIRGLRKNAPTLNYFRVELSRRSKRCLDSGATKKKISYYRVWLSGVFYRMYAAEKLGAPVDFFPLARKIASESGNKSTKESICRKRAGEYNFDYNMWKRVNKL